MDVIVSNLAWLPKAGMSESDAFLLKKRTTLIPPTTRWSKRDENGDEVPKIINMWRETPTHVGVPRAYFMTNKSSRHNIVLQIPDPVPRMAALKTNVVLRSDDQEPVVEKMLMAFRARRFFGGILQAYTGYGKTVAALEFARRLGFRTLIFVHKNPLKEQWIKRIKQFMPDAKIGVVQGPKCKFEGCDFVIAMIQSMMLEAGDKYPDELWSGFGLVIADEVHRMGSMAFSTVAPRFNTPYLLGISATPKRKDGCDAAFKWVIGEVIAAPTDKNRPKPIVYLRNTGVRSSYQYRSKKSGEIVEVDLNELSKPTILKRLAKNKFRNGIIIADLIKSLEAGRSPLIMAERLDILHAIAEGVQEQGRVKLGREISAGMYIGKKKEAELDSAAQCDIVLATVQLAKEGIDIEKLDTLFMITPLGDPVQIIGRIGRAKTVIQADGTAIVIPPKHEPMVVDYIDYDIKEFKDLFFARLGYYRALGCKMIGMKV